MRAAAAASSRWCSSTRSTLSSYSWLSAPQRGRHAQGRRGLAAAAAAAEGGGGAAAGTVQQMPVTALRELLDNEILCQEVQFVDVREQWEWDTARLPHFKLMPLSQASSWAPTIDTELDPQRETICLCHHGVRSQQMAAFLASKGFADVKNVVGGIAAFSLVDPRVPEY